MKQNKEKQWEENVNEARILIKNYKNSQMRIAKLALEVCEINRGGVKYKDSPFTLKKFAEECGIKPKTLSGWLAVKKNVYDKLDTETRAISSWTTMDMVSRIVTPTESKEKVCKLLKEAAGRGSLDNTMIKYLLSLKGMVYNFQIKDAANKVKKEILEEILFYIEGVRHSILLSDHGKIEPKNNGYTSRYHKGSVRIGGRRAGSITGYVEDEYGKILLKDKEQAIFDYMVMKKRKSYTPTEIGKEVGKHNDNNASAWAHRSLQKLMAAELVERTPQGHYFLKKI